MVTKERISPLPVSIQHDIWRTKYLIRQEKKRGDTQIGKKEIKLSLFADSMIICVKNLKKSTGKLELISNLARLQYTRLIHTRVICFPLYHKEYLKVEIKNTTFKLISKQIELLRYKSKKICKRSIWGKLQNYDDRNQRNSK